MKKILTLYFSHSGNTRRVAELIQQASGGDIAAIKRPHRNRVSR
ncbi:MAG: hypothetical protein ACRC46_03445 [Thermoguttaceae bacterium]